MKEAAGEAQGRKLLTAVERLIRDDEELIAIAERHQREIPREEHADEAAWREAVAALIVSDFSNRSAISGGAAALPSILPGFGTVVSLVGGTLADMALMLKFEVEMALCLTHLHGWDIRQTRERQIAFLLASVNTYEAKSDQNLFVDLAAAEGTAVWNYTPRQISKALVSVMTKIALLSVSKGLVRVVPFVGVVVGASMNKVLTGRVGNRCIAELKRRRELEDAEADEEAPVKAKVRGRKAS